MTLSQVTFELRGGTLFPGEIFAICGDCDTLGNWNPQFGMALHPEEKPNNSVVWKTTLALNRGVPVHYRYFCGYFLEPKTIGGPCQVIVNKWETHLQPRSITPLENESIIDDGQFGIHNGVENLDSGWLTCQTEIRLRLHFSEKPPVVINKKKFKKSRFRVKVTLEGPEDDEGTPSPIIQHKMANVLEISLVSDNEFQSRHSQPDCGYALQPDRWTEYSIQTMEPDNLELLFDFFEEDLSETIVQGDAHPGHVGIACLLSSTIAESGKSAGILTLPIMSRNSRKTLGKVRVDYIVIKPLPEYNCNMKCSFSKYWNPRSTLDVGHRGAGNSTTTTKLAKVQENTIASLRSAANHGAAFVEFDVQLSKDFVPVVYHDLTCCMTMKKKFDAEPLELFEIPVKELTYDQLQLLKLSHVTALKRDSLDEPVMEESLSEHQPFPSLQMVLEDLPEHVGFNIEIKWICQQRDGIWDGNLSAFFDMNQSLDVILKIALEKSGNRRIIFSSFDADVCTMIRNKQNKFPVLFLTQGKSEIYPELMDLRSRTTSIAMSFAQFENLLGICAHTEDLLKNLSHIDEAKSKGLVIFCWGDDNNEHENRKKLRDYGVHGLIYDRIYDSMPEQPNIFQVEQLERLKKELPELKSCTCPTVRHFSLSSASCVCHKNSLTNRVDNVQNA
ncbi:glycerophosphocholine phosphodiesterase GPCPD1 isoform X2 [Monodelphis domestica]|uniref:glycerophosphocholine phosphodiesterase GPCPD1 isoform X2 n=1 Tax=Monodelphis domestica TaxID=13616 RepID=UPI0024E19A97|nr:glycerophosphocholine phosphodiesterase GPCPD1 isoform X2 [Monodelphis domestica]XP_056679496.1 glycerophosphocholine phosphodiesterase GPCPD1 isoform X2 [Monodelphis domestica]